ncbi:hypothetical protein ACFCYM_07325 [Streptomyces sp. NPDC056254]
MPAKKKDHGQEGSGEEIRQQRGRREETGREEDSGEAETAPERIGLAS